MTKLCREFNGSNASEVTLYYNNLDFLSDESKDIESTMLFTPSPTFSSVSGPSSPETDEYEDIVENNWNDEMPSLSIVEQPVPKFRFRYRSEMSGAHGSLLGQRETSKTKTYPTVELHNYGGEAIIRCSLFTATHPYIPHRHQLVAKHNNKETLDHDILVSERNGHRAEFKGLGIIHMSKKDLKGELIRKKEKALFEQLRRDPNEAQKSDQELIVIVRGKLPDLEKEAAKEAKSMDTNKVRLCFEAFTRGDRGELIQLCPPLFSETIQNMKSAETGDLKICRIDRCTGSCDGGDEVFILVEKVCKNNIKVRFFESDDNGQEVWNSYGVFSDFDVHHQYAIVLRTPPYRMRDIKDPVKVKVELVRPKDGATSVPIIFTYKPVIRYGKRTCTRSSTSSSLNSCEGPLQRRQAVSGLSSDQDPLFSGGSEISSLNSLSVRSDTIQDLLADYGESGPDISLFEQFLQSDDFQGYSDSFVEHPTSTLSPEEPQNMNPQSSDLNEDFGEVTFSPISTDGGRKRPSPKETENVEKLVPQSGFYSKEDTSSLAKNAYSKLLKFVKSRHPSRFQDMKNIITAEDQELGPLHAAAYHNQLKELSDLLSLIIKSNQWKLINSINRRKETPLLVAAKEDNVDCVKLLCMAGADVNCTNYKDNTALHIAVLKKHNKCVKALLSVKAVRDKDMSVKIDLDKKNDRGEAPLHIAIKQKDLECAKMLVQAGANLNIKTGTYGQTPLHLAVEFTCKEIISFLLDQKNTNPKEKNFDNKTALNLVKPNQKDIIALFREVIEEDSDSSGEGTLHIVEREIGDDLGTDDDDDYNEDDDDGGSEDDEGEEEYDECESKIDHFRDVENRKDPTGLMHKKDEINCDTEKSLKTEDNASMMDKRTLDIVVKTLDHTKKWKDLCNQLDCSFLIGTFSNVSSPTICLINYLEFAKKVTLLEFRDALEKLRVSDAVKAIDQFLSKQNSIV